MQVWAHHLAGGPAFSGGDTSQQFACFCVSVGSSQGWQGNEQVSPCAQKAPSVATHFL